MASKKQKILLAKELRTMQNCRVSINEISDALNLVGFEKAAQRLNRALIGLATAEGEIEQSFFGARHASHKWLRENEHAD